MPDVLDLIAIILLAISTIYLAFKLVAARTANAALAHSYMQAQADLIVAQDQINQISSKASKTADQDFVKFLSESREFAFQYIESVQGAIAELKTAIESSDLLAINGAHAKLIELLPEDLPGMVK